MSETVGDYLVRRMGEWGIGRVYGYPGDGINGIMGAFNRATEKGEGPGDPDQAGIIKQTIKGMADSLLPHK